MENFLLEIQSINNIDDAIKCLKTHIKSSNTIDEAMDFCIKAHSNQYRKSGEPYAVHPILVAAITAYYSHDEAMILSALLHDVVEDTQYTLEDIKSKFGSDVSHIVDGLTKITEIRDNEYKNSFSNERIIKSALTFRKMLIASIDDVRVFVIKLYDRTHNMLTLDALDAKRQKRIAEETLVVYAPLSHRFGMSTIKNVLEDLSFYYLYPQEYNKIDEYIKKYQAKIQDIFDNFLIDIKKNLDLENNTNIKVFSRIKHYYSIYLKTQRKGINIDEVLDLFAIRIITNDKLDCYRILGKIHTTYKPLISRFKDYIAIPKENGYQTIHTTVFHNAKIFEIQIRTQAMHDVAEYGVAAHWKYKGSDEVIKPNLNWLHTLEVDNENIEEFYSDTKQELFSEDVIVYSPRGDIFTLQKGSTAYDFAYMIHTDVGNKAVEASINNIKKPLLTELKSGDIVYIKTQDEVIQRCSWYDMVRTTKAKKNIKLLCVNKIKQIDITNGKNILNTIFSRYTYSILSSIKINKIEKVVYNLDHLKHSKRYIENKIRNQDGLLARIKVQKVKLKEFKFDNIIVYSNFTISSARMDHCCHPKIGDDILAFKDKKEVIIHHKMCENAYKMMQENKQMVYCTWSDDKYYVYKMVVSLPNTRGELARLLTHLSNTNDAIILFIEYGKDKHSHVQYCTIDFEIKNSNIEKVKQIVSQKAKIIEFYSAQDAYKSK